MAFLWLTGGSQSPFWAFTFFIVLGSDAYFRDRWPIAVLAGLCVLLPFSPLLYERPVEPVMVSHEVIRSVTIIISFIIARLLFMTMQSSLEHASRLQETRNDFILALSHQLKTPLTSLRLALGLMEESRDTATRINDRLLEIALRSSGRLQTQIQRLTELFRLREGEAELSFQAIPLADVARSVMEAVDDVARAKELTTAVNVPPLVVRGDPVYIEAAIGNLVQNAVDFTPKGGTIVISAESQNGTALIRIRDSGPGIPPRQRANILKGYYSLAATPSADRRDQGTGVGIGLVLSKTIVERHGGHLWIEDAPRSGTTVCLTLPLMNKANMH